MQLGFGNNWQLSYTSLISRSHLFDESASVVTCSSSRGSWLCQVRAGANDPDEIEEGAPQGAETARPRVGPSGRNDSGQATNPGPGPVHGHTFEMGAVALEPADDVKMPRDLRSRPALSGGGFAVVVGCARLRILAVTSPNGQGEPRSCPLSCPSSLFRT